MGVQGLWQVLAPVGRRVDIATLRDKTLAIDASIWLVQFVKAMRNRDTGKMLPYAHVVGSLRRILKLLHHRIKPLFVFDGGVPVLKRRIIQQRRQRFDTQEQKLKRTAHKLLLNQMLNSKINPKQNSLNDAVVSTFVIPQSSKDCIQKEKEEEDSDIQWDSEESDTNTKPIKVVSKVSRESMVEDVIDQISDRQGNVDLSQVTSLPVQLQYATIARLKDKRLLRENKRSEVSVLFSCNQLMGSNIVHPCCSTSSQILTITTTALPERLALQTQTRSDGRELDKPCRRWNENRIRSIA